MSPDAEGGAGVFSSELPNAVFAEGVSVGAWSEDAALVSEPTSEPSWAWMLTFDIESIPPLL